MTGGSILTGGNIAYGLFAIASDIADIGTTITTTGSGAHTVFARTGSTIMGTGLTVNASGPTAYAAYANEGSTVTLQDSRPARVSARQGAYPALGDSASLTRQRAAPGPVGCSRTPPRGKCA